MAKSRAKKWFGWLHLWVGLISGILVFLISISGATYAFRDELYNWAWHKEQTNTNSQGKKALPMHTLWAAAQQQLGDSVTIVAATAYTAPDKNWDFYAYKFDEKAIHYFDWVTYDYAVFVNPYTGRVAGVVNNKYEFFHLVKMFHWSLLLTTRYGQPIVGVAVLLFVVSLISGLIIWFPQKIRQFRDSIRVKWNARWRRVNYDLHRSLGFYVIPIALILSITGLVWAFKTVQAIVYVAASQSTTPPKREEPKSQYPSAQPAATPATIRDIVFQEVRQRYPQAYSHSLYLPAEGDTTGSLEAYVRFDKDVFYDALLQYHDLYTGKRLAVITFDELNRGEKLLRMNYDIHVGAVWGIWGKILAFIASLICASLPITGFLIWWGRRNKGKPVNKDSKKAPRPAIATQTV